MESENHRDEKPSRRISTASNRHPATGAPRQLAASGDEHRPAKPEKKKGGWKFFFFIMIGLIVLLAALATSGILGLNHNRSEREDTAKAVQAGAVTVQVVKPSRSPASFEFSLPGNAEALSTATLYARTNGYLKRRLKDIGDRAETGELLAEIDAPEIDAQLNQSRAQLEQNRAAQGIAQVTFDREKRLLEQKVVSKQEYDQSEATFNQAVANVKAAEANVQNLTVQQGFEKIVAPFTGIITTRFLDTGALIASGGGSTAPSIFTMVQADVLRVYIYVPQAYVANINVGQDVEITAPEYPQKVFMGKVTRTAESLDPAARTMRTEIQLPSEGGKLVPGMYLTTRFKVEQNEPALVVPANTVDIRREGPRVALIGVDEKLTYRQVKLGRDFGKTIEVVDGLHGDENLVVNPTTELVEGAKVDIAKDDKGAAGSSAKGGSQ